MVCDRCHVFIKNIPDHGEFVMDYYWIDSPSSWWGQCAGATANERVLCEPCMWVSEGYIKVYGLNKSLMERNKDAKIS